MTKKTEHSAPATSPSSRDSLIASFESCELPDVHVPTENSCELPDVHVPTENSCELPDVHVPTENSVMHEVVSKEIGERADEASQEKKRGGCPIKGYSRGATSGIEHEDSFDESTGTQRKHRAQPSRRGM